MHWIKSLVLHKLYIFQQSYNCGYCMKYCMSSSNVSIFSKYHGESVFNFLIITDTIYCYLKILKYFREVKDLIYLFIQKERVTAKNIAKIFRKETICSRTYCFPLIICRSIYWLLDLCLNFRFRFYLWLKACFLHAINVAEQWIFIHSFGPQIYLNRRTFVNTNSK